MQHVVKDLKDGHGNAIAQNQSMAEKTAVILENLLSTDYVPEDLVLVS